MMKITLPAYAKINLFLDIVSVREDKYHNILSLMQSVSLHDLITVELAEGNGKRIDVFCNSSAIPTGKDNLVYRAAELFPAEGHITVSIEKNIPLSAGLAGGSTDAAATLVALNHLTGNKLSKTELKTLGAKLGADIPFCIDGGAALVEGIGDLMKPVASMPRYPLVIARLGDGMSTPLAYRLLDEKYNSFCSYTPKKDSLNMLMLCADKNSPSEYCKGLYNVFETVVEELREGVGEVKSIMRLSSAAGCLMSGSGTSVFGIFEREEDALSAVGKLHALGAEAHLCYPV
ncbi:MAG: 4-(cytidine 5'-diphospho)-2-C-methyl-D-erythritol kinase [Clostridia bacterium]|nr:4-(cytidine 5'-diphospho)-2-C-methyl-D-erythritol kinase [Clostridia bacterium]